MPFVARGAGTGLSGGCLPAEGGLVISLMRMNRVLEVDYDNQIAVVEPGLVNLHLSWAVGPQGFYYAPDPVEPAGLHHRRQHREQLRRPAHAEVRRDHQPRARPRGRAARRRDRVARRQDARSARATTSLGLFVGSEGTFGIATKIVVRILKKPQAVKTVLAVFDEVDQASEAVSAIIARGLVPAAMEMIDQLTIQAVEDAFGCGYPRDAAAALLIELDGLAAGHGRAGRAHRARRAATRARARCARRATRRSASCSGRAASRPSAPTAASRPPTW